MYVEFAQELRKLMQNYFHKGDILSLSQIIMCTEKMIERQGGGANELAQLLESQNSLIKK